MGGRAFTAVFKGLVLVGVVWFLSLGFMATRPSRASSSPPAENFEDWRLVGRENLVVHRHLNLNYVSKRRVPNGPDPIHNRRASKTRQPPNRV